MNKITNSFIVSIFTVVFTIIATFLFSPSSNASFVYEYTGNTFTVNADKFYGDGPEGPGFYRETFEAFITATISTPNLFTNGEELNANMTMSLSGSKGPDFGMVDLMYPIFPDPFPEFTPRNSGTLHVNTVDALGLPTDWNIAVYSYIFQGGRGHENYFITSTNFDSISGYDEPYYNYSGSLINSPGSWTVSEVTEPANALFMLAGLGWLGLWARKHQQPKQ